MSFGTCISQPWSSLPLAKASACLALSIIRSPAVGFLFFISTPLQTCKSRPDLAGRSSRRVVLSAPNRVLIFGEDVEQENRDIRPSEECYDPVAPLLPLALSGEPYLPGAACPSM